VAIRGDGGVIAVSSPRHAGAGDSSGAVLVFTSDSGWAEATLAATLTHEEPPVTSLLGGSLDIDAEALVAGAHAQGPESWSKEHGVVERFAAERWSPN
jgi:hypothetical protein